MNRLSSVSKKSGAVHRVVPSGGSVNRKENAQAHPLRVAAKSMEDYRATIVSVKSPARARLITAKIDDPITLRKMLALLVTPLTPVLAIPRTGRPTPPVRKKRTRGED